MNPEQPLAESAELAAETESDAQVAEPAAKKRRRWPWILLAGVLLLGLGLVFAAPLVIAPIVRGMVIEAGADRGYAVSIASSRFGWLEGLKLEGISVRENIPHGIRAEIDAVEVAPRWRGLLGGVLALGRCRVERPVVVVDPERRPPRREGARPPAPGTATDPAAPESAPPELDLPLVVVAGRFEVLPASGRPGFRLENLNVNGHFYGAERRLNGTLQADLVTGEKREPLRLSGDVVLGDRSRSPSGSAFFTAGGIDLASLRPLLIGTGLPPIDTGTLRLDGEARAEGDVLVLVGRARIEKLRMVHPSEPARVLEEPEVSLQFEAAYDPRESRVVIRHGTLSGAPLELDFDGKVSTPRGKTAELNVGVRGDLARLHPLAAAAERVSGRLDGRLKLTRSGPELSVQGRAEFLDLIIRLPADGASKAAADRTIREPRLAVELDLTGRREPGKDPTAAGTVRATGEAVKLDLRFDSAARDAVKVVGTLSGDAARMLSQAGVRLPASMVTTGRVETHFDGIVKRAADGQATAEGRLRILGPTVRRPGLVVEGFELLGDLKGETMRLEAVRARVNGGTVVVGGQLGLPRPGALFSLSLDAKDVQVTQYLAPLLRYVVPLFHLPEGMNGRIGGAISAQVEIGGPFPPRSDADLARLTGKGVVRVDRGFVEGSPLVSELLASLGRRPRYEFEDLDTRFHLADGTVFHDSFEARGRELSWGFKGTTKLDTTIDYRLAAGPLLERLYRSKERKGKVKGWERVLKDVLKQLDQFPVSLGGTLDTPRLAFHVPTAPGGGKDPVNELLEGLLGGRKKKPR